MRVSSYQNQHSLRRALRASLAVSVVSLAPTIQAQAVAYEPFDYPAGALGSASGGTGWGGNWSSNSTTNVVASGLTYGNLATTGGSIGNLSGGQNRFGASRAIDLATPGLLDDGAELWFSLMMGYDTAGNRTNSRLMFVLGSSSLSGGNNQYYLNTDGATGLGVNFGRTNSTNGTIVATHVTRTGASLGTGQGTVVVPSSDGNNNVDYRLVVGRITWGATDLDNDIIDIFLPDTDLTLGSIHSTISALVDQSGYDTISFARGDKVVMDEIRFGASYADVTPVATAGTELTLSGFTYNPLDGASEVSIKGSPETTYKLVEADDLDFSAPDQDPVPLTGATVGALDGNQVTTDANGDATVQFNLGTSKPATFIRAEELPPSP